MLEKRLDSTSEVPTHDIPGMEEEINIKAIRPRALFFFMDFKVSRISVAETSLSRNAASGGETKLEREGAKFMRPDKSGGGFE